MEWTDGMEYLLTKFAKTHHHGCGKVVCAVLPLLASTGLLCLASSYFLALYPGPRVECSARGQGHVLAVLTSGDVCVCWNEPKVCRA